MNKLVTTMIAAAAFGLPLAAASAQPVPTETLSLNYSRVPPTAAVQPIRQPPRGPLATQLPAVQRNYPGGLPSGANVAFGDGSVRPVSSGYGGPDSIGTGEGGDNALLLPAVQRAREAAR